MQLVKGISSYITGGILETKEKNKDTSLVKLLDRTIGVLSKTINQIDKFLKNKNIDLGKLANSAKDKGKGVLDSIKTNKDGEDLGFIGGLKDKGKDTAAEIRKKFSKFKNKDTAPPEETSETESTGTRGGLGGLLGSIISSPLALAKYAAFLPPTLLYKLLTGNTGNLLGKSYTSSMLGLGLGTGKLAFKTAGLLGRGGLWAGKKALGIKSKKKDLDLEEDLPEPRKRKSYTGSMLSLAGGVGRTGFNAVGGLVRGGLSLGKMFRGKKSKDGEETPQEPDTNESLPDKTETKSKENKDSAKGSFYSSLLDKFSVITDRLNPKDDKDLDKDGVTEADWAEKANNRAKKREDEVKAEKEAVINSKASAGKHVGPYASILDKLALVGGIIGAAVWKSGKYVGKALGKVAWWVVKKVGARLLEGVKWIGNRLWQGVKWIGGRFWQGLKWVGNRLISGLGSLLKNLLPNVLGKVTDFIKKIPSVKDIAKRGLQAAKNIGSKALRFGRAALPYAARALGFAGRAAAMFLTGPVGWGVAIGTAVYGAYKLYKYLTRNNIAEDISGKMVLLRLQTYGFGSNTKDKYSKIFDLEMILKENIIYNDQDKTLTINKPSEEQSEKIYELFDVGDDGRRKNMVDQWLANRFIPSYHAFMLALKTAKKDIELEDLDKLNAKEIQQLMLGYKYSKDALNHKQIPFYDQTETTVTKDDIEATIASINKENNDKLNKDDRTPEQKIADEVAKKRAEDYAKSLANKSVAAATLSVRPGAAPTTTTSGPIGIMAMQDNKPATPPAQSGPIGIMAMSPNAEEPPTSAQLAAGGGSGGGGGSGSMSGQSVNEASGQRETGTGDMEGIKTALKREQLSNVNPDVYHLLEGMAKEYKKLTGKDIVVTEAHRSYQYQAELYKRLGPGKAAPPGRSLHEFGLAIDIDRKNTYELEKLGLLRKYGFTVPIGAEPWHIEPIGVSLDPDRSKSDPNYRKQAILASPGKGGGGYGLLDNSRKYGRDLALQKKIFGGEIGINSLTPEKEETQQMVASTSSTASQGYSGALDMNALSSGTIAQPGQTPSMVATTSTPVQSSSNLNNIGSSYASSISPGNTLGNNNKSLNLSAQTNLSPVQAIKQAAAMTGLSEETLMTFGKLESGLRGNVSSSASTAAGLFQMTDETWKEQLTKHGAKYGFDINTPKSNTLANALMTAEYAKWNLSQVGSYKQAGLSEETALYLAHHFGATGANNIIKGYLQNPNAPIKNVVSSSAYSSNQSALSGKTISGYFASLDNKFAVAKATPAEAYKGSGATAVASNSTPSVSQPSSVSPAYEEQQATNAYVAYTPSTQTPKPSPTLNQSVYDVTRIESQPMPRTEQSSSISVNTDKLEVIMNDQLTTLTQIATVLGTINDKLDLEKLSKAVTGQSSSNRPQQGPMMREVPHTGVNVGRRLNV